MTPSPNPGWAFFVDFDGTITDRDGFDVLVHHFADESAWQRTERELAARTETLRAVLARQTGYVRGSFEDVYDFHKREIAIDPTFAPFVKRCTNAGIAVTVVSSGIGPIVRARLRDAGLGELDVVAPDVEIRDDGWRMIFIDESENGTDKAGRVRALQATGTRVAFAGDGHSDFEAARVADRTYAKRGRPLARYLARQHAPFIEFETFDEVLVPARIPERRM